ncbi:MAG TPA: hypothetical protein VHY20_00515, partial [Pirellulales bacterium]|nr:hypothetical protein [Pirellulales bacterium]
AGRQAAGGERQQLLTSLAQARTTFRLPTVDEVDRARQAAISQTRSYGAWIDKLPTGEIARKAVRLDDLANQLQRVPADAAALAELDERLQRAGGSPQLVALERAVDSYLDFVRSRASATLAQDYPARLEELAAALQADQQTPSPQSQAQVREAYERLPHVPGNRELRLRVCREISFPNQVLTASAAFLNEELSQQPLALASDINNKSSGIAVSGRANTQGTVSLVLHPSAAQAEIDVQFHGDARSQLTASQGPIHVAERGTAQIMASQIGYLSAEGGIRTGEPVAHASSDIRPSGVGVDMRSRLLRRVVSNIAWRKAWEKKATSDQQAEQQIETQIKTALTLRTAKELAQINQMLRSFYPPNATEPTGAPRLSMHTTATHLICGAEFASPWQVAASAPPPALTGIQRAMLMQIHQSALDPLGASLCGRTISEPDFRELVFDTLALTPEDPAPPRGCVPLKVTLADRDALNVRFENGLIIVTVKIQSFTASARQFELARSIRVAYRPQIGKDGLEFVRDGAISVGPQQATEQPDLAELLERVLPRRASTRGPTIVGGIGQSHHLKVSHISSAEGWLNVAWVHDVNQVAAKHEVQR